jgi:hypothetical protein
MFSPYLSVVVTSRNDNHGGTLTRRMQTFVNALVAQCRRHNVPTELIFVEWNPPADKPKLADALRWPKEMGPCQVRIIEVSPKIHARYQHAKSLPLYQFIAKNAGIRRARGEFVLATNIDVLLNHPLMQFIAERKLEKGKMYRIDRHDVETFVPEDAPIDEMLAYCDSHLLRVNAREGTYPVTQTGMRVAEPLDVVEQDSGISLEGGWFEAVPITVESPDKVFRFCATNSTIRIEPGALKAAGAAPHLVIDLQPGPGVGERPFMLIAQMNGDSARELGRIVVMAREKISIPLPANVAEPLRIALHCDAQRVELPGDPRDLRAFIYRIDLQGQPPRRDEIADVFPVALGVAAGRGWGAAEPYQGGHIRWLLCDGEVFITAPSAGKKYILMDFEPGPGVGRRPFSLSAVDEAGSEFFRAVIMQRQKVAVPVEFDPSRLKKFTLRIEGGPPDGDPRLKALLHQVEVLDSPVSQKETARDVFPAGISVAAGRGWYGAETRGNALPERVRWLNNDGEVWYALDEADPRRFVVLELEPGPGVESRPCRICATDDTGDEIFSAILMGRQIIAIPVQPTDGRLRKFVLHIDGTGVKSSDGRILTALLTHVDLVANPSGNSLASERDVFPLSQGLAAGKGWYAVEEFQGQYVRWFASDGEIWFAGPVGQEAPIKRYALLDFEPGPAVYRRPFVLRAVDEDGREFFSAVVTSRRPIAIPIEFVPGRLSHFTIHLPAGRADAYGRVLGALLTQVKVVDEPPPMDDVVPECVALGAGWYGVEHVEKDPVRWMTGQSEMLINLGQLWDPPREIVLDVEPGPSVGRHLDLTIRDDSGATLYHGTLLRRETITLAIPKDRREVRLFFDPGTNGETLPDGRNLVMLAWRIALPGATPLIQGIARPGVKREVPVEDSGHRHAAVTTSPPPAEPMVPSAHADIIAPIYLHNNACGDFTLMHRDHWFEIRGHAEWDAFSIHLDSLLCYCAHHSGAVETVLADPMRCYHIEHSVGSGWTPEGMDRLLRRIRQAGIRDVDWREVGQIGVILRRYNSPVSFSPSDWGLVNDELPETVIG